MLCTAKTKQNKNNNKNQALTFFQSIRHWAQPVHRYVALELGIKEEC